METIFFAKVGFHKWLVSVFIIFIYCYVSISHLQANVLQQIEVSKSVKIQNLEIQKFLQK
jgi:hypothetical protein